MKIIIDGIDASGKSTLANKLLNTNIFKYILHLTKNNIVDYDSFDYYLGSKDDLIFDRFHLSEEIFPSIYKRTPKISFDEYEIINKKIIENNIIYIVFICSDLSIINQRLKERNELNYLTEMPAQNSLFSLYANYFKEKYNYENFYIIDIAEEDAYNKLDIWLKNKLKRC